MQHHVLGTRDWEPVNAQRRRKVVHDAVAGRPAAVYRAVAPSRLDDDIVLVVDAP